MTVSAILIKNIKNSKTDDEALEKIKKVFSQYPNVNGNGQKEKGFLENTPLMEAAFKGFLKVSKYLIEEKKADPNQIRNSNSATALEQAIIGTKVKEDCKEVALYLVDFTEIKEPINPDHDNVLHFAALNGLLDLIKKILIKNPRMLNICSRHGSVLHAAVITNQPDQIEFLLDSGIDTSITNQYGEVAFFLALKNLNIEIIECFLKKNKAELLYIMTPSGKLSIYESLGKINNNDKKFKDLDALFLTYGRSLLNEHLALKMEERSFPALKIQDPFEKKLCPLDAVVQIDFFFLMKNVEDALSVFSDFNKHFKTQSQALVEAAQMKETLHEAFPVLRMGDFLFVIRKLFNYTNSYFFKGDDLADKFLSELENFISPVENLLFIEDKSILIDFLLPINRLFKKLMKENFSTAFNIMLGSIFIETSLLLAEAYLQTDDEIARELIVQSFDKISDIDYVHSKKLNNEYYARGYLLLSEYCLKNGYLKQANYFTSSAFDALRKTHFSHVSFCKNAEKIADNLIAEGNLIEASKVWNNINEYIKNVNVSLKLNPDREQVKWKQRYEAIDGFRAGTILKTVSLRTELKNYHVQVFKNMLNEIDSECIIENSDNKNFLFSINTTNLNEQYFKKIRSLESVKAIPVEGKVHFEVDFNFLVQIDAKRKIKEMLNHIVKKASIEPRDCCVPQAYVSSEGVIEQKASIAAEQSKKKKVKTKGVLASVSESNVIVELENTDPHFGFEVPQNHLFASLEGGYLPENVLFVALPMIEEYTPFLKLFKENTKGFVVNLIDYKGHNQQGMKIGKNDTAKLKLLGADGNLRAPCDVQKIKQDGCTRKLYIPNKIVKKN